MSYEPVEEIAARVIRAVNEDDTDWLARHTAPEFVELGCIRSEANVRKVLDLAFSVKDFELIDDISILGIEQQEIVPVIVPVRFKDGSTSQMVIQLQRSPEGWRTDLVFHAMHWFILAPENTEMFFSEYTPDHYRAFADALPVKRRELEAAGVNCLVFDVGHRAQTMGWDDWQAILERGALAID